MKENNNLTSAGQEEEGISQSVSDLNTLFKYDTIYTIAEPLLFHTAKCPKKLSYCAFCISPVSPISRNMPPKTCD
jgi:hypothetical protein